MQCLYAVVCAGWEVARCEENTYSNENVEWHCFSRGHMLQTIVHFLTTVLFTSTCLLSSGQLSIHSSLRAKIDSSCPSLCVVCRLSVFLSSFQWNRKMPLHLALSGIVAISVSLSHSLNHECPPVAQKVCIITINSDYKRT